MKEFEIIADSGGTKTDWLLYDESGISKKFTSESYHPRRIDADFIRSAKLFWSNIPQLEKYQLTFYGSGCFQKEKARHMKEHLIAIGFVDPVVYSDIELAAKSLELVDGWGAICGTGSVVFKVESGEVTELRGGLGRELGDEGSGFYFGKLLAKSILNNELSIPEFSKAEIAQIESYSTFAQRLYGHRTKMEIRRLHEESIQALIDNCLEGVKIISFVGSYAFHYQELFKDVLLKNGIVADQFIEKPIEKLINYPL